MSGLATCSQASTRIGDCHLHFCEGMPSKRYKTLASLTLSIKLIERSCCNPVICFKCHPPTPGENVQSGGLEHNLPPGLTSRYRQSRLLSCHCHSVLEESEGKASGKRICKRERQQTSLGVKHRTDQHHAKHRYIVQGRDTVTYGDHLVLHILDAQILHMKSYITFSFVYACIQ